MPNIPTYNISLLCHFHIVTRPIIGPPSHMLMWTVSKKISSSKRNTLILPYMKGVKNISYQYATLAPMQYAYTHVFFFLFREGRGSGGCIVSRHMWTRLFPSHTSCSIPSEWLYLSDNTTARPLLWKLLWVHAVSPPCILPKAIERSRFDTLSNG